MLAPQSRRPKHDGGRRLTSPPPLNLCPTADDFTERARIESLLVGCGRRRRRCCPLTGQPPLLATALLLPAATRPRAALASPTPPLTLRLLALTPAQAVDDMIGDVVKALEETGQLDNTYLFYTGDNGERGRLSCL